MTKAPFRHGGGFLRFALFLPHKRGYTAMAGKCVLLEIDIIVKNDPCKRSFRAGKTSSGSTAVLYNIDATL